MSDPIDRVIPGDAPVVTPAGEFKPGGVIGPQDVRPVETEMALKEFHQSGLLWWVNHALLWDLGLALSVEYEPLMPGEGENSRRVRRLFVRDHVPPHRIVDHNDGPQYEAFQRWLSVRAGTVR
jgi:hypothetical protein